MENNIIIQNEETRLSAFTEHDSNKIMWALAALVGALGITASGGSITTIGADALPQIAAIALPGLMAWIISYLMYQKEQGLNIYDSVLEENILEVSKMSRISEGRVVDTHIKTDFEYDNKKLQAAGE